MVDQPYHGKTRRERHDELIAHGVRGGIYQARVAYETAKGGGPIHMNILWEMGGAEEVLHGTLQGAKGLIDGVTCGAGMPYRVAEITASYGVYYYPIISSARAFRALWNGPTISSQSGWAGSSMKIPGALVVIMGCRTAKTRRCRNIRSLAYGRCGKS